MKKIMILSLFLVGLMVIVGCSQENPTEGLSEDEQILQQQMETATAGNAIFSGNLNDVQYLDLAKNVVISGDDYKCSTATATSCWVESGKTKRTYMYNGALRTGSYSDGCMSVAGKWRSNDYGCLGNNLVYCWKYCGDGTCNSGNGVCGGDTYQAPPVCGNGVVDVGETCETCAADAGACPAETEFCAKYEPTWPYGISDICVGDTALASNKCNDPSTASECCQTPTGTVFTSSCDGRFLVNGTAAAQCGGVSETRSVKVDCTEFALALSDDPYLPHDVSTCTSVNQATCASCGYSKCRYTSGQEFISRNCYSGSTFVEFVTGDGCDLTATCTETDGGNVPGTAGSVTMTLSDGRSNVLSDSCSNSNQLIEYSCDETRSHFTKRTVSCATGTTCTNGACS